MAAALVLERLYLVDKAAVHLVQPDLHQAHLTIFMFTQ